MMSSIQQEVNEQFAIRNSQFAITISESLNSPLIEDCQIKDCGRGLDPLKSRVNQRICDGITQIQADLEVTLAHVFEQAGSKLQLEGRQEFHQQIEQTKQLLEHLKSRYV